MEHNSAFNLDEACRLIGLKLSEIHFPNCPTNSKVSVSLVRPDSSDPNEFTDILFDVTIMVEE